uniref:Putative conserved secreted protein n=1 Tax=Ornithodoros turicata TaxID=34597 RepID=A0A2R5LE67_9ACAR
MKAVILLALFVTVVVAKLETHQETKPETTPEPEPICPKDTPITTADCTFTCNLGKGKWGTDNHPDGTPCDYYSEGDGVCSGGDCYPSYSG